MHLEWEGYIKTIYRQPEKARRKYLGVLVDKFVNSEQIFIEVTEDALCKIISE